MGADLYRRGFDEMWERGQGPFEAACARRDGTFARLRADGVEAARLSAFDRDALHADAAEAQAAVDAAFAACTPPSHSFRDPYNDGSLIWRMGLTWNGLLDGAAVDDHGFSPPSVAAGMLARVTAPGMLDGLKAIPDAEERDDLIGRWDRLVHFLTASIEAGDAIRYSV